MQLDIEVKVKRNGTISLPFAGALMPEGSVVQNATFTLIEPPIKVGDVIDSIKAAGLPCGSVIAADGTAPLTKTAEREWRRQDGQPLCGPISGECYRVLRIGWGGDDE